VAIGLIQQIQQQLQRGLEKTPTTQWKTVYAALTSREYILLHSSKPSVQRACVFGVMDSGLPGIASLRFFSKFRFAHTWRIREKLAEIFILALEEETVHQSLKQDIERAFALAIAKFGNLGSRFPKPERCLRKKFSQE
jgi:hypothetical protein